MLEFTASFSKREAPYLLLLLLLLILILIPSQRSKSAAVSRHRQHPAGESEMAARELLLLPVHIRGRHQLLRILRQRA
ncbi:hypothetical protein BH20VER2_BH20VER2_04600 [soil metagenome]